MYYYGTIEALKIKEKAMINLIPVPRKHIKQNGQFVFDNPSVKSDFDMPLLELKRSENADIIIKQNTALEDEGYILNITRDKIFIESKDEAGAYYALQSIRQLSRYELGERKVDCCFIEDAPRFKWRGLQLDSSRHFWTVEQIKKYLDNMFMMKLNVFHWHLTDDQGWRLEIKKYPLLTQIGSKRKYTHTNGWGCKDIIDEPYEGFYSQDQIRDIVEYANARNIMIVPEVDFPAHCAAALAAYPQLACRELEREVPGYFGGIIPENVLGIKDWNRTICVGKESTIQFVLDVIDEVCDLFPSPYFHIGGDEAPKDEWKKCPHCQKAIANNNLKNEEDLQGWFNNHILEYLKSKGRQLIGWNEILAADNLDKSIIAQYWTPKRDKNVEKYIKNGGKVIMSKHQAFYFDMPYALYPLKSTYNFKSEAYNISSDAILGVEGELWSEWIDNESRLELLTHPRMEALSEIAWSQYSKINWSDFKERLDDFKPLLKQLNTNYAIDKISLPKNRILKRKIQLKFRNGDIHLEDKLNEKYILQGEE